MEIYVFVLSLFFFKYRSTSSNRVWDGRGTGVEGALKEKRRVCDRKYYEKMKLKKQNEGQPIQLAKKEQKRVYNKTVYEKDKEKKRLYNKNIMKN